MKRLTAGIALFVSVLVPFNAFTWNIPGHMLSGAIAYQILQRENPSTIPTVRSVLEKISWYESRWKVQLDQLPEAERNEVLFILAARWADDVALKTLPRAVCRGIKLISRSSQQASQ